MRNHVLLEKTATKRIKNLIFFLIEGLQRYTWFTPIFMPNIILVKLLSLSMDNIMAIYYNMLNIDLMYTYFTMKNDVKVIDTFRFVLSV